MIAATNISVLDQAREEYRRDGATVLRGALTRDWIERLGPAVDKLMASGRHGFDMAEPGEGRFFGDLFSWLHEPTIAAFVRESGLAALAGRLMGATAIRFFYDQLLVKEPGSSKRTPWHQDLPYWPATGEDILSIWVPIDAADPENGVVTYVKGSHRWQRFFPMAPFSEASREEIEAESAGLAIYDAPEVKGKWGTLGDIRDNPQNYEFLSWTVEPGDVIVHHPLTIHGAQGNASPNKRRRALATRWFGDDARWDDSRPHFMRRLAMTEGFPYPDLVQGEPMDSPLFPTLWQTPA